MTLGKKSYNVKMFTALFNNQLADADYFSHTQKRVKKKMVYLLCMQIVSKNTNLLSLKGKVRFRDQILTIYHPTMACMAE